MGRLHKQRGSTSEVIAVPGAQGKGRELLSLSQAPRGRQKMTDGRKVSASAL